MFIFFGVFSHSRPTEVQLDAKAAKPSPSCPWKPGPPPHSSNSCCHGNQVPSDDVAHVHGSRPGALGCQPAITLCRHRDKNSTK